jgi:hypothetical protein
LTYLVLQVLSLQSKSLTRRKDDCFTSIGT